ncbi:MAG: hypothetical protein V1792_25020 [Pseudomonadota bacterium]
MMPYPSSRNAYAFLVALFVVSRLVYYGIGVRFDSILLYCGWQFLEIDLLQNHLAQSILNLHSQPPLANLFLGLVLKCFPAGADWVFWLTNMVFGLVMAVAMFALMQRLNVSPSLSLILTSLFLVSPGTVLYENLLLYTYPTAGLLCLAALVLFFMMQTGAARYGVIFFALAAVIILTRSLFQIVWPVLACAVLVRCGRIKFKSVVLVALVPMLIVLAWQVKNYHRFGVLATSSWLGLNLTRNTVERLSPEEIKILVAEGRLSPLAQIPAFSDFEYYRMFIPAPETTGVPALDRETKGPPCIGPNLNHIGYIAASKKRLEDAFYVICTDPTRFALNVLDALGIYFKPAGESLADTGNARRLWFLGYWYRALGLPEPHGLRPAWPIVAWYGLVLAYGFVVTARAVLRQPREIPFHTTIAFMWVTMVYVTVTANLTDIWENNRVRFMVDPYAWILLGVSVNHVLRSVTSTRPHLKGEGGIPT